jgi:hypothetical protein
MAGTKQKGDFSRETSPSLRFFEDLVRITDHNKVYPEIGRVPRARPAFPFTLPVLLLVVRVSPMQFSILVAESHEGRKPLSSAGRLLFR